MSTVQIIVISVVLFVLYRFLLKTIGIDQLGIWSLVLATTSVTQIASFGFSGSVVKFVAKYIARDEDESVSRVIQTATLSVGAFAGIVLLVCYPFAKWILRLVVPADFLSYAISVLPYALIALWFMMITSIFQAGLDGYQRIDIRSILLMGGAFLHLLLCFLFAPSHGLMGVAYARVLQNLSVLLLSWIFLKKYLKVLPIIPMKWHRSTFKEIIGYGINFQIISVTSMFYDPITKALLSKFGGLFMVGYYEMASKMIQQFRALIVSANQVIVPAIADLQENIPEKIHSVYLTCYQLLLFLAVPLFSLIFIGTPVISEIWIGYNEKYFILFANLLAFGWFINTINAPSYFAYLGIGKLRWNVVGHISIAILNVLLGFLLGLSFGGVGVVFAWIMSLAIGSSIISVSYHIGYKISLAELIPKSSRLMFIVSGIGILSSILLNSNYNHLDKPVKFNLIVLFLFLIVIFIPIWIHPMKNRMIQLIREELFAIDRG
jgi:O-antigen/teichoic acid export membrane protein